MAVLKCKMCGGELTLEPEATVCECEYCGSRQTVPVADNEKKMNLFSRANRLRFNNEFDKASGIYESIAAEFPEEAEAYWGLLLCKYGIEYVDDPATGNKIPTCHRSSMESVLENPDYELVMEYADSIAKRVYREQAKELEILRKNIVEISDKEEPYDIFICYKETDENGDRTLDSVLAQDVYDALTEKGYRVFFSRISLEDKLGQEYEPYIFAALHSAKIMLAFGTDPDYYDAVWVKNEWSRYLKLIASGEKKTLIPCFKGLDTYDMPKEFARLQAQDMGKVGAIQDLLRGIDKILEQKPTLKVDNITINNQENALLKRAQLFLEEGNWTKVDEYCEQVLDKNPENGKAYLLKEYVDKQCKNIDALCDYYCLHTCSEGKYLLYARRFADESLKRELGKLDLAIADKKRFHKKKILDLHQKNINDPKAQELKKKLHDARKLSDFIETRVIYEPWSLEIIALDEDGKINFEKSGHDFSGLKNGDNIKKLIEIGLDIVGIKYDGSIIVGGKDNKIEADKLIKETGVKDIISDYYSSGLIYLIKENGTIVCFGQKKDDDEEPYHGINDTSYLSDIDTILFTGNKSAGIRQLICRKKDGSLVASKFCEIGQGKCRPLPWNEMENWRDIKKIYLYKSRLIGLKYDGTLVATSKIADTGNDCWEEMQDWMDIEELYPYGSIVTGLTKYGTLVVASNNSADIEAGIGEMLNWKNVVKLYKTFLSTIGLLLDGTIVQARTKMNSRNEKIFGEAKDLPKWSNLLAIKKELVGNNLLGITRDGFLLKPNDETSSIKVFDNASEVMEKETQKIIKFKERKIKEDAYNSYVSGVNEKIEQEFNHSVPSIKIKYDNLKSLAQSEMQLALAQNSKERNDLLHQKHLMENKRAGLGIFKGKEKASLTERIAAIDTALSKLESEKTIRDKYQIKIYEIGLQGGNETEKLKEEIRNKYPIVSIDEFKQ